MTPNAGPNKFEQLSPLLELMYLMVTDMKKYLKVYAEDTKMDDLPEYKEVSEALQNLKVTLDKIYGIDSPAKDVKPPKTEFGSKQSPMPQPAQETKPDVAAMKDAWSQLNQLPTAPQAPVQQPPQFQQAQSGMSVPTPMANDFMLPAQNPVQAMPEPVSFESLSPAPVAQPQPEIAPQQVQQTQAPQASQSNEIDSILAELRKLQSNNRSGN